MPNDNPILGSFAVESLVLLRKSVNDPGRSLSSLRDRPRRLRTHRFRWGIILGLIKEATSSWQPEGADENYRDQKEQPPPRWRPREPEPAQQDGVAQVIAHVPIAIFKGLDKTGADDGKQQQDEPGNPGNPSRLGLFHHLQNGQNAKKVNADYCREQRPNSKEDFERRLFSFVPGTGRAFDPSCHASSVDPEPFDQNSPFKTGYSTAPIILTMIAVCVRNEVGMAQTHDTHNRMRAR